jgi:hypothetical protein
MAKGCGGNHFLQHLHVGLQGIDPVEDLARLCRAASGLGVIAENVENGALEVCGRIRAGPFAPTPEPL